MRESSFLVLHKDTMLRQFLLRLTVSGYDQVNEKRVKKDDDADSYGLEEEPEEP